MACLDSCVVGGWSFGRHVAGNGLGPLSLGYVELSLGFRYVTWILFGISGVFTIALVMFLQETRGIYFVPNRLNCLLTGQPPTASVILTRKAEQIRKQTGDMRYYAKAEEERASVSIVLKTSLTRPVRLFFTEPLVFTFAIWITYAYILISSFSCSFLIILSTLTDGVFMSGIYTATFNYITDSYTVYSSSALGGLSCVRLVLGAFFTLAAPPLYEKLGIHGAGSLLAGLATLFTITPFVMFHYGARLRARSPFAKELVENGN
ncbi:hypothetical protein DXG01_008925 [Tephrocybe rancida]|nr:hypothetical protein DXG01_008925 [Tephrocybe rancida]